MKLKLFLLITLIKFLIHNVFAQTLIEEYHKAVSFYWNNNYHETIKMMNRIIFFDTLDKLAPQSYIYLADAYTEILNYNKAIYFYQIAKNKAKNQYEKDILSLKLAECYILNKQFEFAQIELNNFSDTIQLYYKMKVNFLKGILYFTTDNFNESQFHFENCAKLSDSSSIKEIRNLFLELKKYKKKYNPTKAKLISTFVPGLGQLLCGNIKDGINAMTINSLFSILMITTAHYYTIYDALIIVFPWWIRYYNGNRTNAYNQNIHHWLKKKDVIYKEILKKFL